MAHRDDLTDKSDLLVKQIIFVLIILISSVLACYVPYFLSFFCRGKRGKDSKPGKSNRKLEATLSGANCLAAGVILGALLLDMIPHITEEEEDNHCHGHSHSHSHDHEYPYGLLAMGLSFILLLSLDKIFGHSHSHHEPGKESVVNHNSDEPVCPHDEEKSIECCKVNQDCHVVEMEDMKDLKGKSCKVMANSSSATIVKSEVDPDHEHEEPLKPFGENIEVATEECCHTEVCRDNECPSHIALPGHSLNDDCDHHHHHVHHHGGGCSMHGLEDKSSYGKLQLIIFVVAMGLHSFLEGLGFGQAKSMTRIANMVSSLLPHKILESFALGNSVLKGSFSPTVLHLMIWVYSLLTPMGAAVGILTSHLAKLSHVAETSINGLAAGSFLFVIFVEMIPHEFEAVSGCRKTAIIKLLLITLGFVVMAIATAFHSH